MKVKIEYTMDVPDEYRRALNEYFGRPGLATRQQVKDWFRGMGDDNGTMELDDIIRNWED